MGSVDITVDPPATFTSAEGVSNGASGWRTIGGSIVLWYIGRADE